MLVVLVFVHGALSDEQHRQVIGAGQKRHPADAEQQQGIVFRPLDSPVAQIAKREQDGQRPSNSKDKAQEQTIVVESDGAVKATDWLVPTQEAGEKSRMKPGTARYIDNPKSRRVFESFPKERTFPFQPGFDLYYAGLLTGLVIGFALFADVATGNS